MKAARERETQEIELVLPIHLPSGGTARRVEQYAVVQRIRGIEAAAAVQREGRRRVERGSRHGAAQVRHTGSEVAALTVHTRGGGAAAGEEQLSLIHI